jgi:peptide/nickel transport system permease protein
MNYMSRLLQSIRRNKARGAGIAVLLVFILCALLAPWMAPHDPWEFGVAFLRPSVTNPLGTNDVGQDVFSELIYGARNSLLVGFAAALLSVSLGTVVGLIAGFRKGLLDDLLMGVTDVFLVMPMLPLAILVSVYLGPSIWNLTLVIGLLWWPSTARVIRSQVLSIRESGYVESARALGAGDLWLMRRHVLPNVLPLLMAKFVLTVAVAMLMEASLSFLGLGDPIAKSWGMMLRYAFLRGGFVGGLWWWYAPPGLAIGACILSLSLISFSIEEKSDPRLKRALEK